MEGKKLALLVLAYVTTYWWTTVVFHQAVAAEDWKSKHLGETGGQPGVDKVIGPEDIAELMKNGGGSITTDKPKPPSYEDTIGTTSFMYPAPNSTVNMSFLDVQMNVQTNAFNTTIFEEKFNHSSICMSMDHSGYSCWPMFRISRYPRFANVEPGNHTIVAKLIDPLTGQFLEESASNSTFEYIPLNFTQLEIERLEREAEEKANKDDEGLPPQLSELETAVSETTSQTHALNEAEEYMEDEVDDLDVEERGAKVATGRKFSKDLSEMDIKPSADQLALEANESTMARDGGSTSTTSETSPSSASSPEGDAIQIPFVAIDYPMEGSWVKPTFEAQLQIVTSANLSKFKEVFKYAYMCLSLDNATHTCWPIFEEAYLPKFSHITPGKHTLQAEISHPHTGELLHGTSLGIRAFNVFNLTTSPNKTKPETSSENTTNAKSFSKKEPSKRADENFDLYEEETVTIRKRYPASQKQSSLHFETPRHTRSASSCDCDPGYKHSQYGGMGSCSRYHDPNELRDKDFTIRGNGMNGGIDEVIVYVLVNEQQVPLRVSNGEDYEQRAVNFCYEHQITHPKCVEQITAEIVGQLNTSPHIRFTT